MKKQEPACVPSSSESASNSSTPLARTASPLNQTQPIVRGVAGFSAGLFSTACLHPLDVVKVRFQAQDSASVQITRYTSTWNAFTQIVRTEGFAGLYAGLAPGLIGSGVAWGLYFWMYNMKRVDGGYRDQLPSNATKTDGRGPDGPSLSDSDIIACSLGAGASVQLLTNPIWVLKTRLVLQLRGSSSTTNYKSVFDAIKSIYVSEGLRGFYRGLVPGLFGVSHGALQFLAYERLRSWGRNPATGELSADRAFLFGGVSKMFAATITYPYQVVRTRLQDRPREGRIAYTGVRDVVRRTWRAEGIRGFYRGIVPGVIRVLPHSALTFACYEFVSSTLTP